MRRLMRHRHYGYGYGYSLAGWVHLITIAIFEMVTIDSAMGGDVADEGAVLSKVAFDAHAQEGSGRRRCEVLRPNEEERR